MDTNRINHKDGKIIERIYIFPWEEIEKRKGIKITNIDQKGKLKMENGWYEKYRIKDENVLRKVNKIWEEINKIYV